MGKKIAVIGAGYTGLIAAKKLISQGYDVTIYEQSDRVGGIAKSVDVDGTKIEKHYRHIFKSDHYVIDLIKEMQLNKNLKWLSAKMGYYTDNKKYRFGQPLTLLTFRPLTLMEKLKFRIRGNKDKKNKRL